MSPLEYTRGFSGSLSSRTLTFSRSSCTALTVPTPSGVSTRLSSLGVRFSTSS